MTTYDGVGVRSFVGSGPLSGGHFVVSQQSPASIIVWLANSPLTIKDDNDIGDGDDDEHLVLWNVCKKYI